MSVTEPAAAFDILAVEPADVARQLALVDMALFVRIEPSELMDPANWTDAKKAPQCAPNVRAFVARFNALTGWVGSETLQRADPKERAKVLQQFLAVGRACLAMNNFHGALAIGTALRMPAITRLHATNELLFKRIASRKDKQSYQELTALADSTSNWKNLRAALDAVVMPGIPHLGMFLADIFFLNEGNPDTMTAEDGTVLINLAKKKLLATSIQKLMSFQHQQYKFEANPALAAYLKNPPTRDTEELFEMAKALEP